MCECGVVYPIPGELSYNTSPKCQYENQTSQYERVILVTFYDSMNGNYWKIANDTWNTIESYCLWGGISCDKSCHVSGLTMSDNNVTGIIPEIVSKLEYITILDLQFNRIESGLNVISTIRSLQYVYLHGCGMVGSLPGNFLGKLQTLDVGYNFLSGTLPESYGSIGIQYIIANHNNLTGTIPNNWIDLKSLNLRENFLSGTIPEIFGNETIVVDLSKNLFEGSVPKSLGTESLEGLYLNDNKLSGVIPAEWTRATNLEVLHLDNNSLEGIFSEFLINNVNIRDISIGNNNFTGHYPDTRISYKLGAFRAYNNKFTYPIYPPFASLSFIDLRSNPIYSILNTIERKDLGPATFAYQYIDSCKCPHLVSKQNQTMILVDPNYYSFEFCKC